jgi:methionyl-tRNA formyltransferase
MKIVVFGDGAWAADSLRALRDSGHAIAAAVVRARPSSPALEEACGALGVPVLRPERANAPEFVETLGALAPDLGLSVAYDQILRRPVLETARLGFVNFHAGSLPYYRGRNVVNWAIINGESEIGLTAHYMNEGIDTGDVVLQRALPIAWTDTYGDVLDRVVAAFPEFVRETVELVRSGGDVRRPQAHLPGTYFCGREVGDEWLDWSDSSANLYNKIRAITRPGPGARTLVGGRPAAVWRATYDPSWPKYIATPGQVVGRRDDGVAVKTGDSTLVLHEVQLEGAACETPAWPIGTRLGLDQAAAIRSLLARVEELEKRLSEKEKSHGARRSD